MRDIKAAQRFGKIIRDLRHQRKWTQDDLAAELEVDAAYISRIELGKKNISLETMLRLADAFGVRISFGDKRV
jgi:UDP-N-acetylglucosamine 1-carboxyvinyltransferase